MSDLIFCDADIITMDESRPHAEAIHIKKNIIENIGSNQEILSKKQHGTKIISAKGKTIMPGFIDSHIHIFPGSDSLGKLNLTNAYTFDEVKNLTQKYINENEDLNFIEGTGVHYSVFKGVDKVTRLQLDKIIEEKSLLLIAPDHHSGWANTKALSEASILEGFALPEGNEVVMSADGYAEGMLKENEAIKLVSAQQLPRRSRLGLDTGGEPSPEPNDQERNIDKKILKKGLAHLAKLGITSVHNMDGNFYTLELLDEIQKENSLTCRVKVPFHFKPEMDAKELDSALEMHRRWNTPFLSSGLVKFFMDGVIGSGTAFLVDDYADTPEWKGEALFSEERFKRLVAKVDEMGLQIAVHSIGDAAVNRVLNAYDYARKVNGRRDSRHRIEHIELIQKSDIKRLKDLDVIASMQPVHPPGSDGLPLEPELSKIGKNRFNEAYAWKSIKTSGSVVIFSTDWPVSNVDPLNCIFNALNRKVWTKETVDQRLDLHETLSAYTKLGAYAEFKETKKGMLKEGYFADLIILSGAIDQIESAHIKELEVELTMVDGNIVYKKN